MGLLDLFFNWVDLILLVVAFRFIYKGYKNGLQKELFDCLRMGLVLFLTLSYFLYFSGWLQRHTLIPPAYAKMIAYLGLAFAVYAGAGLLGKLLGTIGSLQFSGWFDKTAVFFVALLHGVISAGFAIFFIMLVPVKFAHEQVYEKSFAGKRIAKFVLKNHSRLAKIAPEAGDRATMQDFQKQSLSSSVRE